MARTFDPFGPECLADPYPAFAEFRRCQPVFFSPELDYWVLSRYADVRHAFRDTTRRGQPLASGPPTVEPPMAFQKPRAPVFSSQRSGCWWKRWTR